MTRHFAQLKKRTNVRFISATALALLITGCGTVTPLSSETASVRTHGPAMCESFGPETRCNHSDSSRVARELDRVNRSAQMGFRGW